MVERGAQGQDARAARAGEQPPPLDDGLDVRRLDLPETLSFAGGAFAALWLLRPRAFSRIHLHGREVALPRWSRAYDRDYHFSGVTTQAVELPSLLAPLLGWVQSHVDERLNGVLANWYDGRRGHYIGAHRDQPRGLVPGSPIVTLSFGEERAMRFRKVGVPGFVDIAAPSGSAIVIPWDINRTWKHEIPKTKKAKGRRVSVTVRAFKD